MISLIGAYGYAMGGDPTTILPGVTIGSLDVSGRQVDEAKKLLRERLTSLDLTFKSENVLVTVDTGAPVARFNVDEAVGRAFTIGRDANLITAMSQLVRASFFGVSVPLPYTLDKIALKAELTKKFAGRVKRAENARLIVRVGQDGSPAVSVAKELDGVTYDLDNAVSEAEGRLRGFSDAPIAVRVIKDRPLLAMTDVEPLTSGVEPALRRTPLTLKAKGLTWTVSRRLAADWLEALPDGTGTAKAKLGLNREKMGKFFTSRGEELTVAAVDAVFETKDGRVVKFEPSVPGERLDIEGSASAVERALFGTATGGETTTTDAPIELPMTEILPAIPTLASNPHGITEVIGIGETNFRGSPKNRRINIAIGAKTLDGLLVMPGDEFSLLKALGDINAAAGYKEELVIKEDKTVPEFGGGLCQIGSTTFRAVLASGLPVTARQNHSYRVPYYERDGDGSYIGPGKDATIYDPAPDFRFMNDTGHAVLIKTKIAGDRLTFTFWGAKDGRTAAQTAARVYNVVPPPPKKLIETPDLPPGKIKCTESPHAGSDASFSYTVTYPSGEVKKKDFVSHYRPWGEVCLIGIDPNALPANSGPGDLPSADVDGAAGR
jgi:vancomycin resistance protein YoaR